MPDHNQIFDFRIWIPTAYSPVVESPDVTYVFVPSTTASPLLGSVDVQCIKISSLPSLHTCASLALPDGVVSQVQRRKQILE